MDSAAIRRFFGKLKSRAASSAKNPLPFIVFDEAYFEYAHALAPDYPDTLAYLKQGFNVIVLRTFSKIFGLAGLRVGYGIGPVKSMEPMDRVRPPFNVSSIAQQAALAALSDDVHLRKSVAVVREGLAYLRKEFDRMDRAYLPTAGNFLLVESRPFSGRELFAKLLRRGVIVRAMDEYEFPDHFRVTVGKPEENRFFISQLKEVVKDK